MPAITLALRADDEGRTLIATAVTDATGSYYFREVPSGVYVIVASPPPGTQCTARDAGDDARDNDFDYDWDHDDWSTLPFTFSSSTADDTRDVGMVVNDAT